MRKKQGLRIVSSILAASMALTMMPTAAFAAGTAGTSNAENSAVSQADEAKETLVIKDGRPTSSGNEASGWVYRTGTYEETGEAYEQLVFYNEYVFDQNVEVKCSVLNNGTIKAGIFDEFVLNNEGVIENGTFQTVTNSSEIKGGTFKDLHNAGTVENATIGRLNTIDGGTIQNSVFGLLDPSEQAAHEGARAILVSGSATVNGVIEVGLHVDDAYNKVYVLGDRDVTVTYTGDSEEFDGWKAEPEVTFSEVSTDKKTVKFAAPDKDITLTATEKVYPLTIVNGKPTGKGSLASGWTYETTTDSDGDTYGNLYLYGDYTFDQNVEVDCYVFNAGKIKAGTFKKSVHNDQNGVIEAGTFERVENHGTIKAATITDLMNYGNVQNADIKYLYTISGGTIQNSVAGSNEGSNSSSAYVLTIPYEARVNDLIDIDTDSWNADKVYVFGDRELKVTYTGDIEGFDGWNAIDGVAMEKVDNTTVKFKITGDATLTIKEKVLPLEFDEDGIPTTKGNKTSGWTYSENTALTFYKGYVFDMPNQTVKCDVQNMGTIKSGTFAQGVSNYGYDEDDNQIKNGTITGGVFAYIREYSESGIKLPDNTHTLSAVGSVINDEILMAAYVVGDNQKVKVSYFGAESDFESWKGAEELNVTPTETTIEFVMPAKDVALGINYKDNALEFGADGMPTHAGGKNWECVQSGEEAVLMMYDGAVLDTAGTVKAMVVAYPGSIIRNGTFENTVITYGGVIENGIFNEQVTSGGTIQNGTFNDTVANMNIKMDKPLDSGNINLGINVDISECAGLITGGTFHKDVQNCGIIEGGSFVGAVYCIPLAEMIGKELEQQGITFTSVTRISGGKFAGEVYNAGEITGGQFSAEVTNIGTIENGLFSGALQNTTSANLTESMSDGAVATMALFGDAAYAVEMQNSASAEKTYIGTIKDGNFANTVTNNGGQITGGVFWNKIEGDAVANVHTLTANDSHIGAGNLDASGSRAVTRDQVYTVGKECVYVSYAGTIDFGSWKTNDVDLSTAAGKKSVIFTMPGDKDVTLTASAEKPVEDTVIVVKPDEKPNNEGKTIEEDLNNQGTLNNGTYTGEVTNNNTIEGGTFEGNVSNDEKGKISDGEFKADVQNAGTIENGKFAAVVTNNETGKIADGEFTGKVENKGTIQNGTFTDTVTNDGTIENGKFAGEVKGTGTINGGTFQKVSEAAAINGGVFGAESSLKNAKITPSALKIETGIADGSVVNDVIGGGAAVAMLALFEENDVATQAADAAETVAYVVGDQTLTVKYSGSDKSFDKWDTTGLTDAKLSADGKTVTFKMNSDVTLKAVAKKSDSGNTDKPNEQPAKNDSGAGALIVGGVLVAGGVATGVLVYKLAVEYIQAGLPEGAAIPETREQLAVALWQKAGQPEVAVEEGVTLTDTEKAMRWAVENQLVSAEGEDSVSKIDVLLAVYKASKL